MYVGRDKSGVAAPWLGYFAALGADPGVQAVQVDRARGHYWRTAIEDATTFGMLEALDALPSGRRRRCWRLNCSVGLR